METSVTTFSVLELGRYVVVAMEDEASVVAVVRFAVDSPLTP